jgi:uncharacterized SAM-binding protein YcdF (DUF218 family)
MYLNKILPVLFSPIVLALLAIVLAVVTRRRGFAVAAALLLWLASTPLVADRMLQLVQGDMVRLSAADVGSADVGSADAIVVLAGSMGYTPGRHGPASDWGGSVDRVLAGIELARAGRAVQIVFSSGMNAPRGQPTEGERARDWALQFGVEADRILLSPRAENTAEEARLIRQVLPGAAPRVLLVTSAYHVPRASLIFAEAGFRVIAFPVDIDLPVERKWFDDWLPDPKALVRTDTAVRELIGLAYYRLVFRAVRLELISPAQPSAAP